MSSYRIALALLVVPLVVSLVFPLTALPAQQPGRAFTRTLYLEDSAYTSANVSTGDVNGDGHLDLILAKGRHWPLVDRVLLGDGQGGFARAYDLGTASDRTYSALLADMDGDGDLDVVVSNDRPDPGLMYLNRGDGTFTVGSTWGEAEWSTRQVQIADLNGDSVPDLIVANRSGPRPGASYICLGVGGGRLEQPCRKFASESSTSITPADLDGDGLIDLVVPHRDGGQGHVYLQQRGSDTLAFARLPFGEANANIRMAVTADLDRDGRLDIIAIDEQRGARAYFARSDGTFGDAVPIGAMGGRPYSLAVADMDADGAVDVIVGYVRSQPMVLYNDGGGRTFEGVPFGDAEGAAYGFAIADLDKDGALDIAVARSDARNVVYFGTPGAVQPDPLSSVAPPARFANPDRLATLRTAFPAIDSLVRRFVAQRRVPGYAFGVIVDGRLEHIVADGIRDLATSARVDTGTVFRIASMSKSFAALAILQLRDEGRVELDALAETYVPELASLQYATSDAPRITVRHLLTHSAGLPEDNPWGDQQLDATEEAFSEMMRRGMPFSTVPGTQYEYSNFGFAILGRIVANVSGVPYAQYLRERILLPLGMTSTTLESSSVDDNRLAYGYRLQDGEWLLEPPLADGAFGVMGGMLTTPADLAIWVSYMLNAWPARDGDERGPVKRSSLREMQQVQRFSGATADARGDTLTLNAGGYGYGLRVVQTCDLRTLVSHTGGLPGYGSIMSWLPEHGVGIIGLGSLTYTGWTATANEAIALLRATGALEPRQPQPAPVLLTRRAQVTRLINQWTPALADSLAAMNLFRDESAERRALQIASVRDSVGGACTDTGEFIAENALRGTWRLRCATGDLAVRITLAPTVPARVQYLSVTALERDVALGAAPVCRR